MMAIGVMSVVLLFLFVLSAFCSSSETVFFSFNPMDVRRHQTEYPNSGRRIRTLLRRPTALLSAILILNTLVNISASSLSYRIALRVFATRAEQITIPVMTLLLLVFGEFGPKRIGLRYKHRMARLYAPVLTGLVWVTTPLRRGLEAITHAFEPVFRLRGLILSDEEFESVVDASTEEGVINGEEKAMIKAIVDLDELRASDCMTPRVDLRGIDLDREVDRAVSIARESGLKYLVLYRGSMDEVEGFLDVRRFLLDPEHRIEGARLPSWFVPESVILSRLLRRFQQEKRRMAAVVDEYGGLAGVITRGDILEEVTGEVYDELSRPHPTIEDVGPGLWRVDPSVNLDELNRTLDLALEAPGADRLSGWLSSRLGRLPERGDTVTGPGCRVSVLRIDPPRVTLVEIEKTDDIA